MPNLNKFVRKKKKTMGYAARETKELKRIAAMTPRQRVNMRNIRALVMMMSAWNANKTSNMLSSSAAWRKKRINHAAL
jgi:hypothetical protein